jgi:hypothetical protein
MSLRLLPLIGCLLAMAPLGGAASAPVLPFMSNNYLQALDEARARGAPIFIEAWAPW